MLRGLKLLSFSDAREVAGTQPEISENSEIRVIWRADTQRARQESGPCRPDQEDPAPEEDWRRAWWITMLTTTLIPTLIINHLPPSKKRKLV